MEQHSEDCFEHEACEKVLETAAELAGSRAPSLEEHPFLCRDDWREL